MEKQAAKFFDAGARYFEAENSRRIAQERAARAVPNRNLRPPGYDDLMRKIDADVARQEVAERRYNRFSVCVMAFIAVVGLCFLSFVVYSQFVPIYVR